MRLLIGHILPRNASNFICSHLGLKNFPQGETPGPLLTRVGNEKGGEGNGLKGTYLPLKRGGKKGQERGEGGKVGEGKGQ